jgi:hypothetical protein
MRAAILLFGLLIVATPASARAESATCKNSPRLVAPCFTVHGRLFVANGGWNIRIWRVGTHRILAVVDSNDNYDDSKPPLPNYILKRVQLYSFATSIFADYRLCPLTSSKPEHMQRVCMVGASHIFTQKPRNG